MAAKKQAPEARGNGAQVPGDAPVPQPRVDSLPAATTRMGPVPERPRDIEAYIAWLKKDLNVSVSNATAVYHRSVAMSFADEIRATPFWTDLPRQLHEWQDRYYAEKGFGLLTGFSPELKQKGFDAFLLKTFRKNCLRNENWPDPPDGGWYLPENWYSRITDVARTLLVVRYLDGVEFLLTRLCDQATLHGLPATKSLEARIEGYYAGHVVLTLSCEIPREKWDTIRIDAGLEIQVTTQIQDVMRTHLHDYYDVQRVTLPREPAEYMWDYRSPEFATGYLGHILHYVEGMIVEIRDRKHKDPQ